MDWSVSSLMQQDLVSPDRKLGGSQSWIWHEEEEKNVTVPVGFCLSIPQLSNMKYTRQLYSLSNI